MTDATAEQAEAPGKSGKTGLIIGIVLALAGAAGGYFLTTSGLLPIGATKTEKSAEHTPGESPVSALPVVEFVDLPPVIVSVNTSDSRHLKFHAQLEVEAAHAAEVEAMKPRIMDVMNTYLRAIDLSDLQDSLALMRIRGHLHRRIGMVVGEGRVRDVLVMEFVLN
ncbi:flagellar basal body-associated protein FliL [Ruegeria lacuscaerulensis ITI-1157]|nr:flagellar basal body-associated protein FliL [Ruegeria lacuscaerulensis ITI-1157]SHJ63743.1 flagellar FliL protein [Ruegeria lacuscaerulensis ITI-1157]